MSDAREWLESRPQPRIDTEDITEMATAISLGLHWDQMNAKAMRRALLAVLDLHEPVKHPMWSESYRDRHDLVKLWDRLVCRYCYDLNYSQYGLDDQPDEYDWPCSTVESINAALGVSE